ncbi:hypothetical protein [Pseudochelatococcus contaminans]|uniref:Methylaspartate ammonia-lyase n=1 Tax=Pseudochelatococcus contaminans TaxID=1538103 RepID=A0A7W5Z5S7_9HYPH|nr:hypothetical protein [Pseudochelatococcus contaminans]MBB3810642.1 methylaspartate ammonia-lyase [Pseudochelatococcus contaminans]
MNSLIESTEQGRGARTASRRLLLVRRRKLASLRKEVGKLHDAGYSTSMIAHALDISPREAIAFCPKPSKKILEIKRLRDQSGQWKKLPDRAIRILIRGRYAYLGGNTDEARARALSRIAAAYTKAELLAEPGIGHSSATQIELWLEHIGLHLKTDTHADTMSTTYTFR